MNMSANGAVDLARQPHATNQPMMLTCRFQETGFRKQDTGSRDNSLDEQAIRVLEGSSIPFPVQRP